MCSKRCAKPVLPADLVLRADVVPDVDGHDGRGVVLGDDQARPLARRSSVNSTMGTGMGLGSSG